MNNRTLQHAKLKLKMNSQSINCSRLYHKFQHSRITAKKKSRINEGGKGAVEKEHNAGNEN